MASESTTAEDWRVFTRELAVCLGDLAEDDYLIVSYKRANYYVQFAAQGGFGMRVEAACNTYIEPPASRLTVGDYVRMALLGWHQATQLPPEEIEGDAPADGSPNFFMDWSHPVDFERLAMLATDTFIQVYKIHHPGELQYRAFAEDGTQVRFPNLRIKRADS